MKRSEMVKNIKELIELNLEPLAIVPVAELLANAILYHQEQVGMAPPERYRYHDWNERGITYSQWIQEPSKVRLWDREEK